MEAASLIPDDTRVDANKFVTVIRSRGLVSVHLNNFSSLNNKITHIFKNSYLDPPATVHQLLVE